MSRNDYNLSAKIGHQTPMTPSSMQDAAHPYDSAQTVHYATPADISADINNSRTQNSMLHSTIRVAALNDLKHNTLENIESNEFIMKGPVHDVAKDKKQVVK